MNKTVQKNTLTITNSYSALQVYANQRELNKELPRSLMGVFMENSVYEKGLKKGDKK